MNWLARRANLRIVCSALLAVTLGVQGRVFAQGFGQSFGNGFGQSMQQGFGQNSNNALDNPALQKQAPKFLDKERTLDDFFPKTDVPYTLATPYDMNGLKVTGLDPKYTSSLGQNLFIVVENTPYNSMSDIYRENRQKGKSSFVTADCVVHAYFTLNNSILRDIIYEKIMPGMSLMLQSMLQQSSADYKEAEDPEVKGDIAKNMAYIVTALRLLDPALKIVGPASTTQLVDAELKNISAGKTARSAIFGNDEDYAFFRPCGFYDRESKLRNFYRCRQWLSRIKYPLTDSDLDESPRDDRPESRFRQSVLLFRSLDNATINGAPAMDYWNKFYKVWQMMGGRENASEHPLTPSDYKTVFRSTKMNLSNVLQGLSEPFFRTKLLLSIRRNRPMELNSTSILTVKKKENDPVEQVSFRFMPLADEPELPWLADLAQNFTEQKGSAEATPFSLLELYARGSTLATNILSDITWKLDGDLFKTLPKLIEATSRKRATAPAPLDAGSEDGRWAILSKYFKPMTESTQTVFKTSPWMRRRLLSAFAGWVDSHVAFPPSAEHEPVNPTKTVTAAISASTAKSTATGSGGAAGAGGANASSTGTAAKTGQGQTKAATVPGAGASPTAANPATSTTTSAATSATPKSEATVKAAASDSTATPAAAEATGTVKSAAGNYLEPAPYMFKSLRLKMQQTLDDLSSIDYLPARSKQNAQDFINLCQKLEDIAKREVTTNFITPQDSHFLSNIDETLDKFPNPTQAVLHLASDTVADKNGKSTSGVNLCIGKPGLIFMLLRIGRKETLCRGAVYTYYEVAGGALRPEHWERKLQYTMAQPPKWTADFEVQQTPQQSTAQ